MGQGRPAGDARSCFGPGRANSGWLCRRWTRPARRRRRRLDRLGAQPARHPRLHGDHRGPDGRLHGAGGRRGRTRAGGGGIDPQVRHAGRAPRPWPGLPADAAWSGRRAANWLPPCWPHLCWPPAQRRRPRRCHRSRARPLRQPCQPSTPPSAGNSWPPATAVPTGPTRSKWRSRWTSGPSCGASCHPASLLPPADFEREVVAVFADGTGGPGNCSERRLDGVVFDTQASLCTPRSLTHSLPRSCDLMLGGSSVFAVALSRAALPVSPFTLQLQEQRIGGDKDQVTVDLGS